MHIVLSAVAIQVLLRLIFVAASFAPLPELSWLAVSLTFSPAFLVAETLLLAGCGLGLQLRFLWAAVPLVGYQTHELISVLEAGPIISGPLALMSAAFGATALLGMYNFLAGGRLPWRLVWPAKATPVPVPFRADHEPRPHEAPGHIR